jgi:hypothetical protein
MIFNDDPKVVVVINVSNPDTFKDDNEVVLLLNFVNTEILDAVNSETLLFHFVNPDTWNDDINVVLPSKLDYNTLEYH